MTEIMNAPVGRSDIPRCPLCNSIKISTEIDPYKKMTPFELYGLMSKFIQDHRGDPLADAMVPAWSELRRVISYPPQPPRPLPSVPFRCGGMSEVCEWTLIALWVVAIVVMIASCFMEK